MIAEHGLFIVFDFSHMTRESCFLKLYTEMNRTLMFLTWKSVLASTRRNLFLAFSCTYIRVLYLSSFISAEIL